MRAQPLTLSATLLATLLTACASDPVTEAPGKSSAIEASRVAASMVGKPYRYGGNSPRGFDCSGLVYFSYQRAGMSVPRTTNSQRARSRKVSMSRVSQGDLLFFNQDGRRSAHVGIYIGRDRFVHAPSSGKQVRVDALTDPYWQKHLVDARRF